MIRFSAVLVAVAIGVLIGGIAASELLLVYIAIATSAVALVALAVGVVLKREELFGEGQGLAPAQAGASPGSPARVTEGLATGTRGTGAGAGEVLERGTPPLLQGAAVGPGAAFAGRAQSAQPPAARETQSGPDSRGASTAVAPVPGTRPPSAASGTPVGWGTSVPPVFAPPAADATAAGPARPSWFHPPDKTVSTETPATAAVPVPGGGGWSWLNDGAASPKDGVKPAEPAGLDEDDWPTRYSWLDDEPDEDGTGPADGGSSGAGNAGPENLDSENAGTGPAEAEAAAQEVSAVAAPADPAPESRSPSPADPAPEATAVGGASDPIADEPAVAESAADEPVASASLGDDGPDDEPPTLHLVRDAAPTSETADAAEAAEPEGEAPATAAEETPDLVSVVRGVPRYHQEDCVLIRFMSEGDTQKMPVAQAREAGRTPCTACQPEG